jgi:hypothetical protein
MFIAVVNTFSFNDVFFVRLIKLKEIYQLLNILINLVFGGGRFFFMGNDLRWEVLLIFVKLFIITV